MPLFFIIFHPLSRNLPNSPLGYSEIHTANPQFLPPAMGWHAFGWSKPAAQPQIFCSAA
jgi:hypothetical protein